MSEPQGEVIRAATDAAPRHSEASAVALANGDVLLAWSRFEGEGDNATACIAAISSSDAGVTWHDDERVLVENVAGLNVMSPAVGRLPDGGLGLIYSHRESTLFAQRMFRRSDDEGATWSDPVAITTEGYKTGCHDRFTVLASGRVCTPLHCTSDWDTHYLYVRNAWSDDNGASWRLSDPVVLPFVANSGESGCIEPDIVQRADGSLLMVIRTAMGTLFRAESDDDGEHWTGLRSLEVVAPVAPAIIRRLPQSDDLVLFWNWSYDWRHKLAGVRCPLACAVSNDGGASWPLHRRRILEDGAGLTFSYPSCLFLEAHALVTCCVTPVAAGTRFLTGSRSLKVLRVPYDWLREEHGA